MTMLYAKTTDLVLYFPNNGEELDVQVENSRVIWQVYFEGLLGGPVIRCVGGEYYLFLQIYIPHKNMR